MSNRVRQAFQAAAGAAGGDPVTVDQVFSTYLYTGTGSSRNIVNGLDMSGEGGLVWIKARNQPYTNILHDSSSGNSNVWKWLATNSSDEQDVASYYSTIGLTQFNSNGFSLGNSNGWNQTNTTFTSWSFRKAPKFFDCISFVGNDVAGRQISHSLDSEVGMIIIKNLTDADNWMVWHKGLNGGTNPENYYIRLNLSNAEVNDTRFTNGTAPTSSVFSVSGHSSVNANGKSYIAYIFADNSSEDAADQMIRCGSYTGNGSSTGPVIDLGFEPQWIMIKRANASENWVILDTMRGLPNGQDATFLIADDKQLSGSWLLLPRVLVRIAVKPK